MVRTVQPPGVLLREWRQRRRMSQLELALEAEVSARHLSFIETGRAQPSRQMVLHLAERLEIPKRECNALLVAAGFAPTFPERAITDPALEAARKAVDLVLAGQEPYPALAIDRHWNLLASNRAVAPLLAGVEAALLVPPTNVLRLSLHPSGLAPRIVNYREWRSHLIARLRQQAEATADPVLVELMREISAYRAPADADRSTVAGKDEYAGLTVPLRLETKIGIVSMFSTTTVFGTPIDVTLAEIAIESFFPADAESAGILRKLAEPAENQAVRTA